MARAPPRVAAQGAGGGEQRRGIAGAARGIDRRDRPAGDAPGRVEDLAPAFAPGRAAGLVTASRSIVRAHEQAGGSPGDAARREAERLRDVAWEMG